MFHVKHSYVFHGKRKDRGEGGAAVFSSVTTARRESVATHLGEREEDVLRERDASADVPRLD